MHPGASVDNRCIGTVAPGVSLQFAILTQPPAYSALDRLEVDRKEAIRRDVYHMARLGLNAFRLHLWDVELPDAAGNLLENDPPHPTISLISLIASHISHPSHPTPVQPLPGLRREVAPHFRLRLQ